jgi:hypothetical protein
MQREKASAPSCCDDDAEVLEGERLLVVVEPSFALPNSRQSASCVSDPPVGRRPWQAVWAAWNCELLTPSCGRLTFGSPPLPAGSGNLDTPWERMQAEKTSHPFCGEAAEPSEETALCVEVEASCVT